MSRNRIISQSEAIYVGPSPATGYHFTLTLGSGSAGEIAGLPSGVPVNYGYSGYYPNGEVHLKSRSATALTESLSGFMFDGGSAPISGVIIHNEISQLHRVQGYSHDFSQSRTDVNQLGQLARIDSINNTTPIVNFSFSYLLANMANEQALGFVTDGETSALTNILNNNEEEKNYFVKTVSEGVDAIGGGVTDASTDIVGVGNGFVTSYTSEASVGSFPTVNIAVEALNLEFMTGASGNAIPAVNPANGGRITETLNTYNSRIRFDLPSATENPSGLLTGVGSISTLRPGDITMTFTKHGSQTAYDALGAKIEESTSKLQSYNLSINLSRTPIEKLGSRFAFTREIDFPAPITLSVDAIVDNIRTGGLVDRIDCDEEYDVTINIKDPSTCDGGTQVDVAKYVLKKLTLDSQSYSSSIGANKTVTLDFSTQVQGPNQTGIGIFMSGRALDGSVLTDVVE